MSPGRQQIDIAVIGGGAAGFFAAIVAKESSPMASVALFEATSHALEKVRISGGGRCNVTHHAFDPADLIKGYPRGAAELRGPFSRWNARDTVNWFSSRGVTLKTEEDGRMFPVSDNAETVISCLWDSAQRAGVEISLGTRIREIHLITEGSGRFRCATSTGAEIIAKRVLIATGSSPQGYSFAQNLGHTIVPVVPSLFTFKVADPRLCEMAGISFPLVKVSLTTPDGKSIHQTGPMLITHWGLSGPALLKLSAWGARSLAASRYQGTLTLNFMPDSSIEQVASLFSAFKTQHGKKFIATQSSVSLPKNYWKSLCDYCAVSSERRWADTSREEMIRLMAEVTTAEFAIAGRGIYKDEFVTAGGVSLKEIDFRTMESRVCPGLFFAGEILDIDGITGGFNFQSAWTCGYLAGIAMAKLFAEDAE